MATLTIRGLDDSLKLDLRLRAARHSRSMEEEVRQILRQAVQGDSVAPLQQDLASRIRAHVAALGGVELKLPPRALPREPPDLSDVVRAKPRRPAARGAT